MDIESLTLEDLGKYKDENIFTKEVVIPLFHRIAEAKEYDKNGGPHKLEFWGLDKKYETFTGTDVYFGYFDHFYRPKHIGIQCKIANITCGSKPNLSYSFENIRNQIIKAYDHEFLSPLDSATLSKFSGIYIITSKEITKEARELYKNQHQKFVNLDFFDGKDLLFLINKYFKEVRR